MAIGKMALAAGAAIQAAGTIAKGVGASKEADAERDIIKYNAQNEQNALQKRNRAEFGSMIAQSAGTGISGSSFQDMFNNQTIEDATQMAQLKQSEQNLLAANKNKKKSAKVNVLGSLASQAASLGTSVYNNKG